MTPMYYTKYERRAPVVPVHGDDPALEREDALCRYWQALTSHSENLAVRVPSSDSVGPVIPQAIKKAAGLAKLAKLAQVKQRQRGSCWLCSVGA